MALALYDELLFSKYIHDTEQAVAEKGRKRFMQHAVVPSWIEFESWACWKVARKLRIATGSLVSDMFLFNCTRRFSRYLAHFFVTLSD